MLCQRLHGGLQGEEKHQDAGEETGFLPDVDGVRLVGPVVQPVDVEVHRRQQEQAGNRIGDETPSRRRRLARRYSLVSRRHADAQGQGGQPAYRNANRPTAQANCCRNVHTGVSSDPAFRALCAWRTRHTR